MNHRRRILAGAFTLALLAAACAGDDSSDNAASAESGAEVSGGAGGSLLVSGSSTVEPISNRVGELALGESGGELKATVEGPGTGGRGVIARRVVDR